MLLSPDITFNPPSKISRTAHSLYAGLFLRLYFSPGFSDEIKDVFDLEDINLFEDEFFGGIYDEVGLSQCPYDREYNHPDYKNYLVFVSMHS